jgi:DNA-binding IclR family transcriptional regulator
MPRSDYQARVPAVARALAALEQLAAAQQPLSLSALSRAIDVGPSSLLAILTTLRSAGLVTRSGRDGRYLPGPGLVALGAAAAQRLEPLHTFDLLAADLVERLGETVVLWVQQGDGLTMAATREGTRPLRYVPPLGLHLPASGWVPTESAAPVTDLGLVEGELEAGVWMIAASIDDGALLSVVGPAARLAGLAGLEARQALRAGLGGEASTTGAGPIEPGELDSFLDQALVASLSYLSSDGYPASVPLWYDWDGAAFWLVPSPGAEWAEHVRRNPRVSLAVSESTPPLRRVLARGPVLPVDDPDGSQWRTVEARLAARYARLDAARLLGGRAEPRALLRLAPARLIAWRGLLRPRTTVSSPPAPRTTVSPPPAPRTIVSSPPACRTAVGTPSALRTASAAPAPHASISAPPGPHASISGSLPSHASASASLPPHASVSAPPPPRATASAPPEPRADAITPSAPSAATSASSAPRASVSAPPAPPARAEHLA